MSLPRDQQYLGPEVSSALLKKLKLTSKSPAHHIAVARVLNFHGLLEEQFAVSDELIDMVQGSDSSIEGCLNIVKACDLAQAASEDYIRSSIIDFEQAHPHHNSTLHRHLVACQAKDSLFPFYIEVLKEIDSLKSNQIKDDASIDERLALSELSINVSKRLIIAAAQHTAHSRIAVDLIPFESIKSIKKGKSRLVDQHVADCKALLIINLKERSQHYAMLLHDNLKEIYELYEQEALMTSDPMMHFYAKTLNMIVDLKALGSTPTPIPNDLEVTRSVLDAISDELITGNRLTSETASAVCALLLMIATPDTGLRFRHPPGMDADLARDTLKGLRSEATRKSLLLLAYAKRHKMELEPKPVDSTETTISELFGAGISNILKLDGQTQLTDASPAYCLYKMDQDQPHCYRVATHAFNGIPAPVIALTDDSISRFTQAVMITDTSFTAEERLQCRKLINHVRNRKEVETTELSIHCNHPYSRLFTRVHRFKPVAKTPQEALHGVDVSLILTTCQRILNQIPKTPQASLGPHDLDHNIDVLSTTCLASFAEPIPSHLQQTVFQTLSLGRIVSIASLVANAALTIRSYEHQPARLSNRLEYIDEQLFAIKSQLFFILQWSADDAARALIAPTDHTPASRLHLSQFIYACYRYCFTQSITSSSKDATVVNLYASEAFKYGKFIQTLLDTETADELGLSTQKRERLSERFKDELSVFSSLTFLILEDESAESEMPDEKVIAPIKAFSDREEKILLDACGHFIKIDSPEHRASFTDSEATMFDVDINMIWSFIYDITLESPEQLFSPLSDFYVRLNRFFSQMSAQSLLLLDRIKYLVPLDIFLADAETEFDVLRLPDDKLSRIQDEYSEILKCYTQKLESVDQVFSVKDIVTEELSWEDKEDSELIEAIIIHIIAHTLRLPNTYTSTRYQFNAFDIAVTSMQDAMAPLLEKSILRPYLDRTHGEKTLGDIKQLLTEGSEFSQSITRLAHLIYLYCRTIQYRKLFTNIEAPNVSIEHVRSDLDAISLPLFAYINRLLETSDDTLLPQEIVTSIRNILFSDHLNMTKERAAYHQAEQSAPECLRLKLYAPAQWDAFIANQSASESLTMPADWFALPQPELVSETKLPAEPKLPPTADEPVKIDLKKGKKKKKKKSSKAASSCAMEIESGPISAELSEAPIILPVTPLTELATKVPAAESAPPSPVSITPASSIELKKEDSVPLSSLDQLRKQEPTIVSEPIQVVRAVDNLKVRAPTPPIELKSPPTVLYRKPVLDDWKVVSKPKHKSASKVVKKVADAQGKRASKGAADQGAQSLKRLPKVKPRLQKHASHLSDSVMTNVTQPLSFDSSVSADSAMPRGSSDFQLTATVSQSSPETVAPALVRTSTPPTVSAVPLRPLSKRDGVSSETVKVAVVAEPVLAPRPAPTPVMQNPPSVLPHLQAQAPIYPQMGQLPALMFQYPRMVLTNEMIVNQCIRNAAQFIFQNEQQAPLVKFTGSPEFSPGSWYTATEHYLSGRIDRDQRAATNLPLAGLIMAPVKEALDRFEANLHKSTKPHVLMISTLVRLIRDKRLHVPFHSDYLRLLKDAHLSSPFYHLNIRAVWMNIHACISQLENAIRVAPIGSLSTKSSFESEDLLARLSARKIALGWLVPCQDATDFESITCKETIRVLRAFEERSEVLRTNLNEHLSRQSDLKNSTDLAHFQSDLQDLYWLSSSYKMSLFMMLNAMQAYQINNPIPNAELSRNIDNAMREILSQALILQRAQTRISEGLRSSSQTMEGMRDSSHRL